MTTQEQLQEAGELTSGLTAKQRNDFVIALRDFYVLLGMETPTVKEVAGDLLNDFPDHVFSQNELRLAYRLANGALGDVVDTIPAENVPAEISGAWYEIRQHAPLYDQLHDYLSDPDDPREDQPRSSDTVVAGLAAALGL